MSDNEKAIYILTELSKADKRIMFPKKDIVQAINMAIQALKSLNKLDEIITEQIDISYDQTECQTLRWVLDKMSEVEDGNRTCKFSNHRFG